MDPRITEFIRRVLPPVAKYGRKVFDFFTGGPGRPGGKTPEDIGKQKDLVEKAGGFFYDSFAAAGASETGRSLLLAGNEEAADAHFDHSLDLVGLGEEPPDLSGPEFDTLALQSSQAAWDGPNRGSLDVTQRAEDIYAGYTGEVTDSPYLRELERQSRQAAGDGPNAGPIDLSRAQLAIDTYGGYTGDALRYSWGGTQVQGVDPGQDILRRQGSSPGSVAPDFANYGFLFGDNSSVSTGANATPSMSFMDLGKDLRDMFSGNQAATEDLTGSVADATEAQDSWMTQLVAGQWVTDEVTGEIIGHTSATEEATATVGNAALTLETQVDPALSNAALLHALTQAEVLDTEGKYQELDEESMAAAVEGIRDTGKMAAALGISGAEMDGVLQSLISQYGSVEAAFVAAAMSSQSGPSSSPSDDSDPESSDPETTDTEEPKKTPEQVVADAFPKEDASTQAWIVQNMGAVVETGDNAGKTFQQLADNEAYKEANDGQNMPGFAHGGIVPGPVGAPLWAVVHGGERILRSSEAAEAVTINLKVENRNMSEADLLRTVRSGLLRMDRRVVGVLGQRPR
jgi:hypothetical protein